MRPVFISSLLACLAVFVHRSAADGGFFVAVEKGNHMDRLYRIDVDADFGNPVTTPIGKPGALGFPSVVALGWDWEHERLYGFDNILHAWLRINLTNGTATSITIYSPAVTIVGGMAYNPNDELFYVKYSGLTSVVPETGELESANVSIGIGQGIAHVTDAINGHNGLYTAQNNNLIFLVEPEWTPINLGGDVADRAMMFWDPVTDTLFNFRGHNENRLYAVNQVTGDDELFADWGDIGLEIVAMVYVPAEPTRQPRCIYVDDNNDGDIDLIDFGAFQACFTGSRK